MKRVADELFELHKLIQKSIKSKCISIEIKAYLKTLKNKAGRLCQEVQDTDKNIYQQLYLSDRGV